MAPVISAAQAARDLLCCMGLGFLAAALRAVFPMQGKAAFLPDFFAVGLALTLLQGYAAGQSSAGALRWYMMAGAAVGAAGFEQTFGYWLAKTKRALCRAAVAPGRFAWKKGILPALCALTARKNAEKERRQRKTLLKNRKKILQKEQNLLYNSNVSTSTPRKE